MQTKILIKRGVYIMTKETKRKLMIIARYIWRRHKVKVYGLALLLFSIMPAIMTEDNSWLTIGYILCIAMIFSSNKKEEY